MRLQVLLLLLLLLLPGFIFSTAVMAQTNGKITLPKPVQSGEISLEELLVQRRSVREYSDAAIQLFEIGQLLWAAQGITHPRGFRTAPSAGALYPLELYAVAGHVEGVDAGLYHYDPEGHHLVKTSGDDLRQRLSQAALSQFCIQDAAAVVVFAAVFERTTQKYGQRGIRYVNMEVGHAAQNLFLQAEALGLSTVVVGAFEDKELAEVLDLPTNVHPLMLMPIGR